MAWLSRVNFIASDTLSFTDVNNLGNDIRAWGDSVNGGGYTLSNVVLSASSGVMPTVTGGSAAGSTLTLRSTSGAGSTDAIVFQVGNAGGTEAGRFVSSGRLALGTLTPDLRLHVVGTQGAPATSGTVQTGTARFVSINSAMDIGSRANGNTWMQVCDRTNLALNYNLELQPNGGNVGVGATTPTYQTQIQGAGQTTAAMTDAGAKGGAIMISDAGPAAGNGGALLFSAAVTNGQMPGCAIKSLLTNGAANGTSDLAFSTRNATGDTALTERMRITSGGNVGIRTSSPAASASLEIGGTTGALLVPRLTTTERNALTAANGMIIYNTTDNQMQGYINGAWTAM